MQGLLKPRAVIFDVDGTLVDSVGVYVAVAQETWRQAGLPPLETSALLEIIAMGTPFWEAWPSLVPPEVRGDEGLKARCREIQQRLWREKFGHQVRPVPGAVAVLQGLRRAGLLMGIVTSSWSFLITAPFAREGHDLQELVDVIVTREETPRMKPAPDPLLLRPGFLGLPPSHCLYVGDAPVDVLAGKAAGASTVAVLTGVGTYDSLAPLNPDAILESVAGLLPLLNLG